jgi:N6-adenosine-specific RNA methylase IME4
MLYHTILADPPWDQGTIGRWKHHQRPDDLPYPTMTVEQIAALPIQDLAAEACHLWLWTTNQFLEAGLQVMRAWGFKYLAPIHWIKPSGLGAWWVHRTQTVLFGYYKKCRFPLARYLPNLFEANPGRHSKKPPESYELIESVSPIQRLELFARATRPGWHVWGNEVQPHPNTIETLGNPNHDTKGKES